MNVMFGLESLIQPLRVASTLFEGVTHHCDDVSVMRRSHEHGHVGYFQRHRWATSGINICTFAFEA